MKRFLYSILAAAIVLVGGFSTARAISVFTSNQVGLTPIAGRVLQTDGTNSAWVATSTLGISGGGSGTVSTSSSETTGYFPRWSTTSGSPAPLTGTSSIFQATSGNVGIGTTNAVAPLTIGNYGATS